MVEKRRILTEEKKTKKQMRCSEIKLLQERIQRIE